MVRGNETSPEDLPWTECILHSGHAEEDCEFCQAELAGMQEHLNGLHTKIQQGDQSFQRLSGGQSLVMSPLPSAVRLEVLIDMCCRDPKQRMAFEINASALLGQRIDHMLTEARRQVIMQPGPVIVTK